MFHDKYSPSSTGFTDLAAGSLMLLILLVSIQSPPVKHRGNPHDSPVEGPSVNPQLSVAVSDEIIELYLSRGKRSA